MDKKLQDLEDRLAGLVPRALSEEGARRLDDEVDRLVESTATGGRKHSGARWFWPAVAAAACLAATIALLPDERKGESSVAEARLPVGGVVELVSLSRQVTEVSESDWILGDGSELPHRYRSFRVTGTEEFYDDESGFSVMVISESEERVPVVLTRL